jgi:putative ABC transport system permease protein
MSMNFRDRMNELATLKSMGFGGGFVFGLIQLESMCLCLIGGVIGALGPYAAFNWTPLRDFTVPIILHLDIRPVVCGRAMIIATGIGILAAVWPSWLAWRLKVVSALRNLE